MNYKKMLGVLSLVLLLVSLMVAPVAAQDETIVDIAAGNEDFSTLVTAVTAAGLGEVLSGEGPFTVFAPTNDAFAAALEELGTDVATLAADVEALTGILTYHVVEGAVLSTDLSDGMEVTTVNGATFTVGIDGDAVTLTDGAGRVVNVVSVDIEASNGVIYVIDNVLLPPPAEEEMAEEEMSEEEEMVEETPGTIVDIAAGSEDFSTLVTAVTAAGLGEVLSGEGPFTVFAPTNDAFAAALEELGTDLESLAADTELLTSILTYHVVEGAVFTSDISNGMEVTTVNGATFTIGIDGGGVFLTDGAEREINVVDFNIEASNGVIHVIDNVLLPPPAEAEEEAAAEEEMAEEEEMVEEPLGTIVDIAAGNEDFSTLVTAVTAAGLAETLSGEGPFTVFAPTNDAFTAALEELGTDVATLATDPELLTGVLTYHVVEGAVFSSDISDGMEVTTVNGATFTINIGGGGVTLTDVAGREVGVVSFNIEASNGVIHVLDNVLLPLAPTEEEMGEEAAAEEEEMAEEEEVAEEEEMAEEATDTIVDIAVAGSAGGSEDRGGFSLLVAAVQAADPAVIETLSGEGDYTVFAPTNQAFINLFAFLSSEYGLSQSAVLASQDLLTAVLLYHVVDGAVMAEDVLALDAGANVPTLLQDPQNGIVVGFRSEGAPVLNFTTDLVATDILASNGVIHVIDDVLLPQCVVETLEGTGSCGNFAADE